MGKEPVLEIKDLGVAYGAVQVLWDVDLTLFPGERFAVVGPNGSGKSTLLKALQGLIPPITGEIRFHGHRIDDLPPHRRVELGLVLLPEGRRLFWEMSVKENLELGTYPRRSRRKSQEGLERAFRLFPLLKEKVNVKAGALSGGEQQMLAFARGLVADPKLLFLDDPFLGLAPKIAARFEEVIRSLWEEGITILMVGQHVKRLLALTDRACLLQAGRIVLTGEGKELLESEPLKRALLGP